ncbi:5'-3' exonuclease [Ureaplasma ceti]|uniref:5'-3' exonuclease n=1 Tax=Ureaplasma ceti TaxID=3119530 RepID=A0ABP9UCE9_9BACT
MNKRQYPNKFEPNLTDKKTLLIIDANNSLANNYFGIKQEVIQNHVDKNKPLNLHIYTTAKRWINMITKYNPDKVIFVFDSKDKPVFRKQIFTPYKTKSKSKPLLEESINLTKQLLEHLYINYLSVPGFEADDTIASLARQYSSKYNTYIWTNDKDLYQLITPNVKIVKYNKSKYDFSVIDENYVLEHEGLLPQEYMQYKIIYGDKSNNTPGIPGLYWTTLVKKLLREHQTIDNIISLKTQNRKIRKIILNLKVHWEIVELNRQLVTLVSTIDISSFDEHNSSKKKRSINSLYAIYKTNDLNYNFFKNVLLNIFIKNHQRYFKEQPIGYREETTNEVVPVLTNAKKIKKTAQIKK